MPAKLTLRIHRIPSLVLFLVVAAATLSLAAQTTAPIPIPLSAASSSAPIPLSHLYMHFFLYEAHLEHLAQAHPQLAAKGGNIKDHVRVRTGLTEAEWQQVSDSSVRVEATIHALTAKADALIDADRKLCHSTPQACSPTPPNIPQLKQLEQQRDQALSAETTLLESEIGPNATTKLRAYLQDELAAHTKIGAVPATAIRTTQGVTQ